MNNLKKLSILIAAFIVLFIYIVYEYNSEIVDQQKGLVITEVVSKNNSIIYDEDEEFSDYIEIYNNSNVPINLVGYGLSDNPNLPFKWVFPDIVIGAHKYLIIFADSKDISAKYLHTNFALNSNGETVVLTNPNNETLSRLTVKRCLDDMAYSLKNGQYDYFKYGSPLQLQRQGIIDNYDKYIFEHDKYIIQFSHSAGIYREDIEITLKTLKDNVVIRYTTDGSNPTTKSNLYEGPIHISAREDEENEYIHGQTTLGGNHIPDSKNTKRGTVVKAQVFKGNEPVGRVESNTYFIDQQGEDMYSLPIVSLSSNPDNLWSGDDGILVVGNEALKAADKGDMEKAKALVNYNQRGKGWERECYFEYFDESGNLLIEQTVGIRVFGGYSRGYQKKSLRIYAREEYENDYVFYPFFDDNTNIDGKNINQYERFLIRNGGNDVEGTIFRDSLMTGLAKDVQDVQASQPVIVYINGEYFGIYFIRESIDEQYIESHYGIPKDEVAIVECYYEGPEQYVEEYWGLINFTQNNDLSIEENYNYIESRIDLDNFIDYYIIESYLANSDWPHNNVRVWRNTAEDTLIEHDGKYRFILYDTDAGMGRKTEESVNINSFEFLLNNEGSDGSGGYAYDHTTAILRNLMKNDVFRYNFITTFCTRLNTIYKADVVLEQIDYYEKLLEPEIEENRIRYGLWQDKGIQEWYEKIEVLERFAQERPTVLFDKMAEYYREQQGQLIINPSEGSAGVDINQKATVASTDAFIGTYLTNIPIELTALAKDKYEFEKWSNGETTKTITIILSEEGGRQQTYTPIFKKVK